MNKIDSNQHLADYSHCTGCGACYAVCTRNAISMQADKDGFRYPKINSSLCVNCGICRKCCPALCQIDESHSEPDCYAAKAKDETIRMTSSSGGIFSILAASVIKEGGVVFGCVFDESDYSVMHVKAETTAELLAMRGSKYLQSNLRDTFRECRSFLKQGKVVLYSGTPCQIAGLNHFIGKDNQKLITLEVICHGAPSPAVWQKFLSENKYDRSPSLQINFRSKKEEGWKRFHLSVTGGSVLGNASEKSSSNITCISQFHGDNPYMRAFLSNLSLRSSCYHCPAKNGKSMADITLGDFWGIEKYYADFNDNKGISAVMLHSQKSKDLWKQCENDISCIFCTKEQIIDVNRAYINSFLCPPRHHIFMQQYHSAQLRSIVDYCLKKSIWERLICFIKKCIKKLLSYVR